MDEHCLGVKMGALLGARSAVKNALYSRLPMRRARVLDLASKRKGVLQEKREEKEEKEEEEEGGVVFPYRRKSQWSRAEPALGGHKVRAQPAARASSRARKQTVELLPRPCPEYFATA